MTTEILFEVVDADEGGHAAVAAAHGIVTEANSVDELQARVRDAVACHFDPGQGPKLIRLHCVRDLVLAA